MVKALIALLLSFNITTQVFSAAAADSSAEAYVLYMNGLETQVIASYSAILDSDVTDDFQGFLLVIKEFFGLRSMLAIVAEGGGEFVETTSEPQLLPANFLARPDHFPMQFKQEIHSAFHRNLKTLSLYDGVCNKKEAFLEIYAEKFVVPFLTAAMHISQKQDNGLEVINFNERVGSYPQEAQKTDPRLPPIGRTYTKAESLR